MWGVRTAGTQGLGWSSEYKEAEMGRGVWRHGAEGQLGSCGVPPAIPNQSHLRTHLPHEYMGTQQETRGFAPGQASAKHLPSCDLLPEAPHPLVCWVCTRLSRQVPRGTCPGPAGLPSLGFILNKAATLLLDSSRHWKRHSRILLKSPLSYNSSAWCLSMAQLPCYPHKQHSNNKSLCRC